MSRVFNCVQFGQHVRCFSLKGLLLCTSTGVLQEGRAGTDVAVRVAERAADLDTRSAEATCEEDRQMICVARRKSETHRVWTGICCPLGVKDLI